MNQKINDICCKEAFFIPSPDNIESIMYCVKHDRFVNPSLTQYVFQIIGESENVHMQHL